MVNSKLAVISYIFLFLYGCEENTLIKDQGKEHTKIVNVTHYDIPPLPSVPSAAEEVEIEPEIILTDVGFNNTDKLMHSFVAAKQRGDRALLSTQRQSHAEPRNKEEVIEEYNFSEEKYYNDADVSSYPVNRDRVLTTDMHIPCILENGINSQIPGKVIALLDKDVLSPTMKYVLLPAYTKIICHYESLSKTGETRLALTCMRAIRPDGVSITLSDMSASDMSGKTGLTGRMDNRIVEQYGGAFVVSGISALAQMASKYNKHGATNQATTNLSNQLGQVTAKALEKNLDLRPRISIEGGSRIILEPQSDIVLKAPTKIIKRGENNDN